MASGELHVKLKTVEYIMYRLIKDGFVHKHTNTNSYIGQYMLNICTCSCIQSLVVLKLCYVKVRKGFL